MNWDNFRWWTRRLKYISQTNAPDRLVNVTCFFGIVSFLLLMCLVTSVLLPVTFIDQLWWWCLPLSASVCLCACVWAAARLPPAFSLIPLRFLQLVLGQLAAFILPSLITRLPPSCGASLHLHLMPSSAQPTSSSPAPPSMYTFWCCSKTRRWDESLCLFGSVSALYSAFNCWILAVTCLLLLRNSYRVCFCKIASLGERHPLDLATRPSRHALTALLMLLRYATAHQTFCVSATLPTAPPIHFHVPKPGKHRQTS